MRYPSLLLLTLMLMSGVLDVTPTRADTGPDDVLPLLKGYEWTLDEARLRALPDDTWRALLAVARDDTRHNYIRARAREALTLYPNPTVRSWFVQALADVERPATRRQLARTFCRGFARDHAEAVEQHLAPLLDETDPHLRIAVARCLQRLQTNTAQASVRRYRASAATWERTALGTPAPAGVHDE